jgi:predicted nuclease with TOPRIM domain
MFNGRGMGGTLLKPIVQQLDDHFHPQPQPSYFEGAVEHIDVSEFPSSLPPVAEDVAEQRADDVLRRLAALHPKDEATRKRIQKAFATAIALLDDVSKIEGACNKERVSALKTAHVAIREQGRTLLGKISKLQTRAARTLAEMNEANKTKLQSGMYVRQTVDSRKQLSRWASDEEIAEADAAIVQAREQLRLATSDHYNLMNDYNGVQQEISELQRELDKLATSETRLRGELSGRPYIDPEFLLTKVPGI